MKWKEGGPQRRDASGGASVEGGGEGWCRSPHFARSHTSEGPPFAPRTHAPFQEHLHFWHSLRALRHTHTPSLSSAMQAALGSAGELVEGKWLGASRMLDGRLSPPLHRAPPAPPSPLTLLHHPYLCTRPGHAPIQPVGIPVPPFRPPGRPPPGAARRASQQQCGRF